MASASLRLADFRWQMHFCNTTENAQKQPALAAIRAVFFCCAIHALLFFLLRKNCAKGGAQYCACLLRRIRELRKHAIARRAIARERRARASPYPPYDARVHPGAFVASQVVEQKDLRRRSTQNRLQVVASLHLAGRKALGYKRIRKNRSRKARDSRNGSFYRPQKIRLFRRSG